MNVTLYPAEVDRIVDALELLAKRHDDAGMTRAREKVLETRTKIIQQLLNSPAPSESP
jgi:hypothetical protein